MHLAIIALLMAFTVSAHADPQIAAYTSALKVSFQQAREHRNIDLVLPVFKSTKLYLIVATEPTSENAKEYFLTPSLQKGRYCVTVSDSESALAKVTWPKKVITGEQLLKELPKGIEIVVVYPDGGDYITREHLDWYRQAR